MGKTKKLFPLFLNESLQQVALTWLSIFSSLFIYQRMGEVANKRFALAFVFFCSSIFAIGKFVGSCLAEELSLKRGLKFQVALGVVFRGITFIFFVWALRNVVFLIPAQFLWGLSAGTYWFGWHGLVGKLGMLGEYGRALGTASLLRSVARFLAPVAGGLLISFGGYQLLFLIAIGLLFLALLPLFALKGERTHQDTSPQEVIRLFFTHKRAFLAYSSIGAVGTIGATVFVLYLALILKRELFIGEFFSVSVILVAVIKFFLGKVVDWRKKELIVLGSLARSGVWLGRWLTRGIPWLLGLNVVNDLAIGMVSMPLGVLSLEKAIDGRSTGRAVLFREIAISLGDFVTGLVLGIATLLGAPLTFGFVLAVFLALTPTLVRVKRN